MIFHYYYALPLLFTGPNTELAEKSDSRIKLQLSCFGRKIFFTDGLLLLGT